MREEGGGTRLFPDHKFRGVVFNFFTSLFKIIKNIHLNITMERNTKIISILFSKDEI